MHLGHTCERRAAIRPGPVCPVAVERNGEKEKKPRPDGREDGKKKNNNNKIIGERCRKTKPNDGRLFFVSEPKGANWPRLSANRRDRRGK